jgi:hypothetical protein
MLKNTTSPRLYPITILAIITFFIQLFLSLMLGQKVINLRQYEAVTIILYVCLLVMGFIFQKIDGWLVDYERKRYADYIHSIDQHDMLFEKLLYHQAYETYKKKLLNDDSRRKILLKTVDLSRMRGEIHEGILKEAIEIFNKSEAGLEKLAKLEKQETPVEKPIPSISPVDMFLKKHSKSDKNKTNDSIKRATDIFLNDKE